MFFIEFFRINKTQREVLDSRDQLRTQSILSSRSRRELESLEEQAKGIRRSLFLRRFVGGVTVVATVGIPAYLLYQESQKAPDLGLSINEAAFLRVAAQGSRIGTIPQTEDKDKGDLLRSLGDIRVAASSPSFTLAINQPMADFMFRQADLANPALPTRIFFWEGWLDPSKGEQPGGYTSIKDDGSDQIIVISLKAAALEAFLDLDRKKLAGADYFEAATSYFISKYMAHEMAHAGRQTKRLLKKGESSIPEGFADVTHPQIYAFDEKYAQLYNQAFLKGIGQGALIFETSLEPGVDLDSFRTQIFQEARTREIIK